MNVPSVIVLGSVNTDLVLRAPRLPRPGETVLGGRFFQSAGGKGANQAVAAARASTHPVLFIAAVGDDAFGRASLAAFQNENLITRYIKTVPGQPSGVALIFVDEQAENSIGVASGANLELRPADVDAVPDEIFRSAKVFLASLESPLDTVVHGLRRAKAAGLLTILNPAPAHADIVTGDVLRLVDVLTPNEAEACALASAAGRSTADPAAAARELLQRGCSSVIVTLGPAGCDVVQSDVLRISAPAVSAVDTTAAGDAFSGALAVALAEGQSLTEAAQFATRAAALSVTKHGAQPSLATRAEIETFASR